MDILHEDGCTFFYILLILRMGNVSNKSCRENRNRHFMINKLFPENRALYDIMWNNYGRDRQVIDDNTIPRMRIACWATKATNTHSEYVIPTVFARQRWLCDGGCMLRLSLQCSCPQAVSKSV